MDNLCVETPILSPLVEFQVDGLSDLLSDNSELEWYEKLLKDCFGQENVDNEFNGNLHVDLHSHNNDDPEWNEFFLKECLGVGECDSHKYFNE